MNIQLYGTNENYMLILDMYDLPKTNLRNSFKYGFIAFEGTTQISVFVTYYPIGCYSSHGEFQKY